MADIQQWMRKTMMQPTRSRTPSLVPPARSDLPFRNAVDARSTTFDSSATVAAGLRSVRIGTGGGGPRKKISSYFAGNPNNAVGRISSMGSSPRSKTATPEDPFSWDFEDDDADTTGIGAGSGNDLALETALDAIYRTLCQNPFEGLPVGMNKTLLALMEWCRKTAVEGEQQRERIEVLTERLRETEKREQEEVAVYKAEIKRLELVIANGHNGMSRLMAARQDSILGRGGNRRRVVERRELDKSMGDGRHPRARTEGDAPAAPFPVMSPSSKEAFFSRHLSLIGPREIPVGTPPQGQAENHLGSHSPPLENESGLDLEGRDFSRIKEIATVVSIHRGLKPERVLPWLVAFFDNADEHVGADGNGSKARDSEGEKQKAKATRPRSWAPGDDAAVQGEARASTESQDDGDRPRRSRQTSELSQTRRGSVTSDLSISSSEETGAKDKDNNEQAPIRTKMPGPCGPEVGFGAHGRQGERSPGLYSGRPTTMMCRPGSSGSEVLPLLSSSVSSHRTAFRRSSDRFDYASSATRTAGRHANQSGQKAMAGSRPASKSFSGGGHPLVAAAAATPTLAAAASDLTKSKARISPRPGPRTSESGGHNVTAVTKERVNGKENEAGTAVEVGGSHRGTAVGCGEKKNSVRAESSRDVVECRASSRRMAQQQQQQQQQREK